MSLASVIAVTNKMDDDMPDPTTNDLVSAMLESNSENDLDFTKTMVHKEEDEAVAIVDVQRFSINAETATTQSANGLSLDFTNGNFVVLLVGKDQNKPYYGVMIDDDETKKKMFVPAA